MHAFLRSDALDKYKNIVFNNVNGISKDEKNFFLKDYVENTDKNTLKLLFNPEKRFF